MRITPKLTPNPGLWINREFFDTDGAHFESTSWEELAGAVAAYRLRAKLPAGEPLSEIYQQVCDRTPQFCLNSDPKVKPNLKSGYRSIVDVVHKAIQQWILTMLREHKAGRISTVSYTSAEVRAEVCRTCPYQTPWGGNCLGCMRSVNDAARLIVGKLLKNRSTGGLLGCRMLGEDPRVSVWLEQNPRPDAPKHCWRRQ